MSHFQKNIRFLNQQHPELNLSANDSLGSIEEKLETVDRNLRDVLYRNLDASGLAWGEIKMIFLDVDGVLTEGGMFYTESGDEFKRFETKDGMAIKEAIGKGLLFGIISSGVNKAIIQHRADMFGIQHVYVGKEPKLTIAKKWINELGLNWSEVGYIGDDINDLQMFDHAGISACPNDATEPIKAKAHFQLEANGGHGCAREFLKYVPALKGVL